MIEGAELKLLTTYPDERGFFRELIRITDSFFGEGFAQWNHSLMLPGVIKAWHIHQYQVDWWYVPVGVVKAVLSDRREESATFDETNEFILGENHQQKILRIPPGVAHGCKVLQGPAHMFYIVSQTYDPKDEGRIPYDDPAIEYDWLAGPEIT